MASESIEALIEDIATAAFTVEATTAELALLEPKLAEFEGALAASGATEALELVRSEYKNFAQLRVASPKEALDHLLDTLTKLQAMPLPSEASAPSASAAPQAQAAPSAPASAAQPPPHGPETTSAEAAPAQPMAKPVTRDEQTLELIRDFLQESNDGLNTADEILLNIESAGLTNEKVNALFRVFHTVKGVAGFLELTEIVSLAHCTESLMNDVRDGVRTLTGDALEVVFSSTALLRKLLDGVKKAAEASVEISSSEETPPLVARIEAILASPPTSGPAAAGAPAAAPSPKPADGQPAPSGSAGPTPSEAAPAPSVPHAFTAAPLPAPVASAAPAAPPAAAAAAEPPARSAATAASAAGFAPLPSAPAPFMSAPPAASPSAEPPPALFLAAPPSSSAPRSTAPMPSASAPRPSAPMPSASAPRPSGPEGGAPGAKLRETVKVDLERVDSMVEMIGELIIVESMLVHAPEISNLASLKIRNTLSQLGKISRDLQNAAMRMRTVPVHATFQKMARLTREVARKAGREVVLVTSGEGTEMDRAMVERLEDPLVHMVRNAVDHGIEPVADRLAAGKPPTGTLSLSASHKGGSIIIELSDDGRGLQRDAILRKAVEKGLVKSGEALTDNEVFNLIFAPGFSTASVVTDLSGRGVGMDVVKRNIEGMRGRVVISSEPGKGTTFQLVLPLTLAIIDGMLVTVGKERYLVPSLSIVETLQPKRGMVSALNSSDEILTVRGQVIPLLRLSNLLEVKGAKVDPHEALIVVLESVGKRVGLLVDQVLAQQQVVIKALGQGVGKGEYYSGAAILSDGVVGLILNVDKICALITYRHHAQRSADMHHPAGPTEVRP